MPIERYSSSDNWVSKASEARKVKNGRRFEEAERKLEEVLEGEEENNISKEEAKRKGVGRIIDFNA